MTRALGSRYELIATLASGSVGEVWRARIKESDEPVAVKLLRPEFATDPETIDRFVRERRVLATIDHPSVVKVRDLVVEGDDLGIVMDLVEGIDLREHLAATGPLQPAIALDVAAVIADALAAAHDAGVVHSDVKPANILVPADGNSVRLADFGVARLARGTVAAERQDGARYGTPAYVAPEVVAGNPPVGASDVYALGIVLFEMLTGATPYRGGGSTEVLRRHLEAVPVWPWEVPAEARAVADACLARDPAHRPSAADVAGALRAVAPVLVHRPSAPFPARDAVFYQYATPPAEQTAMLHPSTTVLPNYAPPAARPSADRPRRKGRMYALAGVAAAVVVLGVGVVLGGGAIADGLRSLTVPDTSKPAAAPAPEKPAASAPPAAKPSSPAAKPSGEPSGEPSNDPSDDPSEDQEPPADDTPESAAPRPDGSLGSTDWIPPDARRQLGSEMPTNP